MTDDDNATHQCNTSTSLQDVGDVDSYTENPTASLPSILPDLANAYYPHSRLSASKQFLINSR